MPRLVREHLPGLSGHLVGKGTDVPDGTVTCSECPSATVYAHGRCRRCYQRDYMRNRRHKAKPYLAMWAVARPGYKVCRSCEKELPREKFAPREAGKDGRSSHCRDCVNARKRANRAANLESVRAKDREWDRRTGRHTLRRYGVGREQWDAQIAKQGGRCAACGRLPRRRLVGDHCHLTQKFRGIVCDNCNISMGLTGDDPVLLRKLADWIEQGGYTPGCVPATPAATDLLGPA